MHSLARAIINALSFDIRCPIISQLATSAGPRVGPPSVGAIAMAPSGDAARRQ